MRMSLSVAAFMSFRLAMSYEQDSLRHLTLYTACNIPIKVRKRTLASVSSLT